MQEFFEIGIHPNFNENIVKGVGLPAHENVKNLLDFILKQKVFVHTVLLALVLF